MNTSSPNTPSVAVVTGAGGMGVAIARRISPGRTVVIADVSPELLSRAVAELEADGVEVVGAPTDVSRRESVAGLVALATGIGPVAALVHTAGVSPVQASVEQIMHVDLLGTALVLELFGEVIAEGGAGVVISSMAGTMASLDHDLEAQLAQADTDALPSLAGVQSDVVTDSGTAYCIAKRGNQLRVRAVASPWGTRGATVNSISPGIISTPMGIEELEGANGEVMHAMLDSSAAGRAGTPEEIAGVVGFLLGPDARYITGTDVLVDGGVIASIL